MVLPAVETTPVLLLRFTPKASQEVIKTVMDALTRGGIIIIESEGQTGDGPVVLGLTTTQRLLESEAEIIRLVKPARTPHAHIPTIMDRFTCNARQDFMNIEHDDADDYDSDALFTSAERALLLESMINAIPAPHSLWETQDRKSMLKKQIVSTLQLDDEEEESTSTLCQVLLQNEYIDAINPVHIKHIKEKIMKDTYSILTPPPLQAIRNYYGEGVAFYYAWMHYMTKWFVFPGVLGLIVYVLRIYRGDTIDTCDLTPYVGLFTFCWAVLCNRHWERHEAELAYKWGTLVVLERDVKSLGRNPRFRGRMQRSVITGKMERSYPASKRRLKYAVSAIITMLLLGGACIVMVISMNTQGYISRADRELWGDREHPLHYPFFARLSEEGAIFDANSWWRSLLPVILRALVVVNINEQYSKVAETLAEWENHETILGYQNSVILKRVLFEAFDAYIILFYLAIYERDMYSLRLELVGAFNVDSLRRVLTECILPYIVRYYTKDSVGKSKKDDDLNANVNTTGNEGRLSSEANLEEYVTFDDYIEMVIQFGYVVLFASAFPLAAFLAVGANIVEIRADAWKLTHIFRRKMPNRSNGLGMWKHSLKVIAWLSAISNLFLFAFTSSQMQQWFPGYYTTDAIGNSIPAASATGEILVVVLVIEHFLILISLLVRSFIPLWPDSIIKEIEKGVWHYENIAEEARSRTVKRASVQITSLSNKLAPEENEVG